MRNASEEWFRVTGLGGGGGGPVEAADITDASEDAVDLITAANFAAMRDLLDVVQVDIRTAGTFTGANPTLAANVLAIESDTGYMKFGDGATVWTSLAYLGIHVSALTTLLEDVQTAGGAPFTALAALFASYVAAGSEQVGPAALEDILEGVGNDWLSPAGVFESWEAVALPPTAGVIAVDGATFRLAYSTIVQDTTSAPEGLGGERRYHLVFASGDNWLYTPTADNKVGFAGQAGFLILEDTMAVFTYYSDGSETYCEVVRWSGDRDAPVTLTPGAGTPDTLAIDGKRIPSCFYAELVGDTEISAPSDLTGRTLDGELLNDTGGDITITLNAGWGKTYGGDELVLEAAKTVRVLVERRLAVNTFTFGMVSD